MNSLKANAIGHISNMHTAMTHGPADFDARLYTQSLPPGGSSCSTINMRKIVTARPTDGRYRSSTQNEPARELGDLRKEKWKAFGMG